MYAITSQPRRVYCRKIIGLYDSFDDAVDALAGLCPENLMDWFTPGDTCLGLQDKILRVQEVSDADIKRGWTIKGKSYGTAISKRLNELMFRNGITTAELCSKTNFQYGVVCGWIDGTRIPNALARERLEKLFGEKL